MFATLSADLRRFGKFSPYLIFEQGIWAILVFRFGSWVNTFRVPVLRSFLKIIAFFLFKIIEMTTGISIPASVKIGKGFYIGHFGGIIVHSDVQIGENFSIGPGVVLGTRGLGNKGVPQIGNNVYIGVGAKVLGNVKVGNNVKIGANAVVIKDVPDNATVIGIPARLIETS
jgi:serine O-acetyltransferase